MRQSIPAWMTNGLLVLGGVVAFLLCIEGIFAFALSHPQILASRDGTVGEALAYARDYYVNRDRKLVQYMADCAQYDREVTYTLIPGRKCRVVGREYVVEYAGNRAGLRDSDETLSRPEIVVVGDSHGMGWGVRAEESFPKRLQALTGRSVLNACHVVLRHGARDDAAGAAVAAVGPDPCHPVLRQRRRREQALRRAWHAGDPAGVAVPGGRQGAPPRDALLPAQVREQPPDIDGLAVPWRKPPSPRADRMEEAPHFLDVLLRHRASVEGRTVVVVEINAHNQNDGPFIGAVRARLAEPRYAALARWVTAIDLSRALGPDDYYLLDGHLNAAGHEKVARLVAAELERRATLGP